MFLFMDFCFPFVTPVCLPGREAKKRAEQKKTKKDKSMCRAWADARLRVQQSEWKAIVITPYAIHMLRMHYSFYRLDHIGIIGTSDMFDYHLPVQGIMQWLHEQRQKPSCCKLLQVWNLVVCWERLQPMGKRCRRRLHGIATQGFSHHPGGLAQEC